jgi:hypothetical protein
MAIEGYRFEPRDPLMPMVCAFNANIADV